MNAVFDFNTATRQDARPVRNRVRGVVNPAEAFREFLLSKGLHPGGSVAPTGDRVQRCPADGDKPGRTSGWYVFYVDGLPSGEAGDWRTGESWTWCAKEKDSLSFEESKIAQAHLERARRMREQERARLAAEAAARAQENWGKAIACTSHPYLSSKGIASHGLRLLAGKLLIPVTTIDGSLRSIQEIDAEGGKRFYFGGEKKECCYRIPGNGKVAVCEGFATAASVCEATGWTTLVAFDAGNLLPVAKAWKAAHPQDVMVICGDDDRWSGGSNVGRRKAEACAKEVGGVALFPSFAAEEGEPTDWNDLHRREGLEEVKRQLLAPLNKYTININDWLLTPEMFEVEPEPRRDLVENILPLGTVILLASLGGIGKSMKMLDLALLVAGHKEEPDPMDFNQVSTFFGNRVMGHGPVVMYTAEDTHRDNRERVYKMGRCFPRYPVSVIPIIDVAGAYPLILPGDKNGPVTSAFWDEMREQLLRMRPKLVVFDPLSSFALLDMNKPEVATFAIGMFANLASETGACILVTHHLAKTKENITTPEQARALVRGSTAIVDRTRGTYVLWHMGDKQSKAVCKSLGEKWKRGKVVQGCLAKENFGGDTSIKTFVRRENGLLIVRDDDLYNAAREDIPAMLECLENACAEAAARCQPYTKTGANGLYTRRQELPAMLRGLSRQTLEDLAQDLLEKHKLVLCISKGSTSKKWLDIPGGDFALGLGEIARGATEEVKEGKNNGS